MEATFRLQALLQKALRCRARRHELPGKLHWHVLSCTFATNLKPHESEPLPDTPRSKFDNRSRLVDETAAQVPPLATASTVLVVDKRLSDKLPAEPSPEQQSSLVSQHGVNATVVERYDRDSVTVFHKPTQRLFDVNLRRNNELSVFMPHEEKLVELKLSEKFKLSVEAARVKEEAEEGSRQSMVKVGEGSQAIQSINDLLPREVSFEWKQLPTYYLRLAKVRLTGLVVCTTMAGYAMAPGYFDVVTFALVSVGTGLVAASANAYNQHWEIPFDSQMKRTQNRPLVMGQLSSLHAIAFASVTGAAGTTLLWLCCNPLTAGLGVFNLALYTAVYTPMKRWSIYNTWVGAVVGALPPIMGWAASCGTLHPGACLLGALMYAWQFPHFCALSWNIRHDYSRAGYRMMAAEDPSLCRRVSLRYSVVIATLCPLAPAIDMTTWWFAVDSLPLNSYLVYLAWRFYQDGDSKSSRRLFHYTLFHIPALLILMLVGKKRYDGATTGAAESETLAVTAA